jgi:hypothetical protein
MTTDDPLRIFQQVRTETLAHAQRFEGGEHLWLGNAGASRALAERNLPSPFGPFERRTTPETLTYGEIVAFSGDFYESPTELFDEKRALLPWLWQDNNLNALVDVLKKEVDWINLPLAQRKTSYPDENVALWWHAKRFAELALQNSNHFGWHNAITYVTWHEVALTTAKKAAAATNPEARSLLFRQAVFANGFADHFLTDGFAAGHVRTPAMQIRQWADHQGMNDKLAGALIKLIHDQDGHVNEIHGQQEHLNAAEGLHVINSRGDEFRTRCDGQLFLTGPSEPAVEHAVEAVADSIGELLDVYNGAPGPEGVFAATTRIPWAHPQERALIEKFPANLDDAAATRLYDSIRWYVALPGLGAGIRPHHIQACWRELPAMMPAFRDFVTRQAAANPDITRRLAPALVQGYENIR